MFRQIIVALILLFGLTGSAHAELLPVPANGEAFWGLGATGILCYREPCPRHGVFRIHQDGSRDLPLSRRDQYQPPLLRANDEERTQIKAAFETGGCVVVEGHFEGEILVVARLRDECHYW